MRSLFAPKKKNKKNWKVSIVAIVLARPLSTTPTGLPAHESLLTPCSIGSFPSCFCIVAQLTRRTLLCRRARAWETKKISKKYFSKISTWRAACTSFVQLFNFCQHKALSLSPRWRHGFINKASMHDFLVQFFQVRITALGE